MISKKDLIDALPEGKKRNFLGRIYVKAIEEYYYYNNEEGNDIDIDDLFLNKFDELLLQNDNLIKDFKLFISSDLFDEFEIYNKDKTPINELRNKIISYFNINYEIDSEIIDDVSIETNCIVALHDFQERIRRKVINLIFNNDKRFLVHMPTGSGKTRTTAEIIADFIRLSANYSLLNERIKILWIAQSSELCNQAYETIKWILDKRITTNIKLGHFYKENELPKNIEEDSAIIFASIQKLLLNYKSEQWASIRNDIYLVVVDEAHRSVASKWKKALDYFVSDSSVYLLGLTATPGLGVNNNSHYLSTYYHNNKISITDEKYTEINNPIEYLTKRNFLAEIERINIDSRIKIVDDGFRKGKNGEFIFTKKTLNELSVSPSRNTSIINIIKENHLNDKKILVFTCGLEHNKILKSILNDVNITSEIVDTNSKNRNSIINRFKKGNLNILLNYGVLTTGFDAPKTDVCIIARPIASVVMYSQMVGRILRGPKNKGNKKNILYTIKDNLSHGDYDMMFNHFNDFYK